MLPFYKKILLFFTIFLVVWFAGTFLLPLFLPFLLGLGLAVTAEPMVRFLCEKLRTPRLIASFVSVTAAFCFLTLLILLLLAFLVREIRYLAGVMPDMEQAALSSMALLKNWLLQLTAAAPGSLRSVLEESITDFFSGGTALLNRIASYVLSLAGNLLTHVPDSALTLGTTVISGYMLCYKLPRIRRWLKRHLPAEKRKQLLQIVNRSRRTITGWLSAQFRLTGITALILGAGFLLLRIRHGLLWALGVCLVDAFPILGTGTILLPWALVCLIQADTARAVGLAGIYTVVTLIRSVLEPKLVGKQLGLDPLVTLVCLYAGYKLWGIGGMILFPMLTVVILQLLPERNGRL